MKRYYDAIYLSPHLDDAILSCGGQIYQQVESGENVLIVTIMAGDPPDKPVSDFARSLQIRWELAQGAAGARRAEDVNACRVLGADFLHWDIPDCIYRFDPVSGDALYASEEALFGPIHPAEADLIHDLVQNMTNLPNNKKLFVPLTVGHHVDHQLTRFAAEQWAVKAKLAYYEEYPYARDSDLVAEIVTPINRWYPEVIRISKQALSAKIRAVECYRSQISTFFDSQEDLAVQIGQYSQKVGGERRWFTKYDEL